MKSPEDLEKEWWDRWWEQDWSWDGKNFRAKVEGGIAAKDYFASEYTKPHTIPSTGERKTLYQDPFTKKRYTRFHLPLTWSDRKTPTPKASWREKDHQTLADDLTRLLEKHRGTDNPAPFQGMVLKKVPSLVPTHKPQPDAPEDNVPRSVTFQSAWLLPGDTWKKGVFGKTSFKFAWLGKVSFDEATFEGDATFIKTIFSGPVSFDKARFIKSVWFEYSQFLQEASFKATKFSDIILFGFTKFNKHTQFEAAKFLASAEFYQVVAISGMNYTRAVFSKDVSFERAKFSGEVSFNDARFLSDTRFNEVRFSDRVSFFQSIFEGVGKNVKSRKAPISFYNATILSDFIFEPKEFPLDPAYSAGAFRGVHFTQRTSFYSESFFAPGAFAGAILGRQVSLYKDHFDLPDLRTPEILKKCVEQASKGHSANKRWVLQSIANGAQTLQVAMGEAGHKNAQEMLHRLELMAQGKMLPWHNARRHTTYLYQKTSDFGSSIGRPLAFLALAWFLCGVSYWTIHTGFVKSCLYYEDKTPCAWAMEVEGESSWADAFTFSSTATFRPFYVWTLNDKRSGGAFADKLLFGDQDADAKPGAREFWVKLLATAQSLFSIVMLFLSGLAARRYYQVS